jgi:hypothetical protein
MLWLGCGTQGDASVLPDRWPRAGLSGYVSYNPDEPALISQPGWDLDEPAAAPAAPPSAGLVLYGRMAEGAAPARSQLFAALLPSLDAPGEPQSALAATLPWEGRGLRGPSLPDESLPFLLYQGEDGGVGLARRDGESLVKLGEEPLVTAAVLGGGRSIGRVGSMIERGPGGRRLRLYYTVDDAEVFTATADAESLLGAFERGATLPALRFEVRPLGIIAADFSVPPGDSRAAPAERISQLSVRRSLTPSGRVRIDLFLTAAAGRSAAFVSASAYADPGGNPRFLPSSAAVLKGPGGVASSPTVTMLSFRPLLLFGLREVQTSIAAAVLP